MGANPPLSDSWIDVGFDGGGYVQPLGMCALVHVSTPRLRPTDYSDFGFSWVLIPHVDYRGGCTSPTPWII